jgi:hypothetical protein
MRYGLRTLLILLPLVPPGLAAIWFTAPDSLFLIAFYGPLAGLAIFYHLWMLAHRPE